jgi:photosystem II cytochrome c550
MSKGADRPVQLRGEPSVFSKRNGLLAIVSVALLVGCGGQQPTATTPEAPTTPTATKSDVASAASEVEIRKGKALFKANCGRCHVAGQTYGTYGSTDVNLSLKGLQGALPKRDSVASLIDYVKNPTSYDGKTKLLETGEHPAFTNLDDESLRLISSHIIQEATAPGSLWGKGKNVK